MVKREHKEVDDDVQDIELSSGAEDSDEVYVVEKIVNHRKERNGQQKFLIKWEGYPDSENTWEEEDNVFDKDLIKQYWEEKGVKTKGVKLNGNMSAPVSPALATRRRRADEKPNLTKTEEGPEGDDWESQLQEIETIDRCEDGTLIVFIIWKNGLSTEHTVDIVYQKCPQAMLKFYEERLRFRPK